MSLENELSGLGGDAATARVSRGIDAIANAPERREAFISVVEDDGGGVPSHGPLRGAIFSVKDNIDVADVVTTCGSRVFENSMPARADAAIVEHLRALGATYAGKNNMHEFALGATGTNLRFGDMPNPWDRRRHVGGSSGGSAIAVASGLVDIAVGTDSGGSVRMPAAFAGVAGFKPTPGILPMDGVAGASWSIDCLGMMTQTAEDMAFVWRALGRAATAPARPRIAYLDDFSMGRVAEPVWERYREAIAALERAGFELVGVSLPGLESCPRICISIVYPEIASAHYEIMRSAADLYEPEVRALVALGEVWSARNYIDAQRARVVIRHRIEAAIPPGGLLLTPSVALQPPRFGEPPAVPGDPPGSALFSLMRFTVAFNVASCPGLSVPTGLDRDGLPTGLQVIGRSGDDDAVVAVAARIEETLGQLPTPPLQRPVSNLADQNSPT